MGINKFMESLDDANEIKVPKKDYKNKVDEKLKTKFEKDEEIKSYVGMNLLDIGKEKHTNKKIAMSIYFEEDDLKLLKAISNFNNTTVNKTVMSILESPLNITRDNLPKDFDVEKLANKVLKRSNINYYNYEIVKQFVVKIV